MSASPEKFKRAVRQLQSLTLLFVAVILLLCAFLVGVLVNPQILKFETSTEGYVEVEADEEYDRIENGIHLRTGFVEGEGLMAVVNNCTNCHSAQLVTQNRMSRERWEATIRWMQETQNLWDLGANEDLILNYLATNYAPQEEGRRPNLVVEEWYDLED